MGQIYLKFTPKVSNMWGGGNNGKKQVCGDGLEPLESEGDIAPDAGGPLGLRRPLAAGDLPRLASALPALLPVPDHILSCFTPLTHTAPLLARKHLLAHRSRARRSRQPPHASSGASLCTVVQPAGHRPMPPQRDPLLATPCSCFYNSVMEHFHALRVLGPRGPALDPGTCVWAIPADRNSRLSLSSVKNTLNFCFSVYPLLHGSGNGERRFLRLSV